MADRYWVGGTGTWTVNNTANWSETSGGASGASAPTSVDDVYFDSNSGSGNYTVTVGGRCRNFNASGPATGTVTFSGNLSCAGNFYLAATGVSYTSGAISLLGQIDADQVVITTNNVPMGTSFSFGAGMKYSLGSAYTSTSTSSTWLGFNDTTTLLDTNGYTMTVATYGQSQGYVNFRNSTVIINGNNGSFSTSTNANFAGFPDVIFVDTGKTNTTFSVNVTSGSVASRYFKSITTTGTGTGTTLQFVTFCVVTELLSTKTNAFSIKFGPSLGCIVRKFGVSGSSGNVVTLTSTSGTATLTLYEPYAVDYLAVTNVSISTSGVFPFYVGANSTQSANTNVVASVIPSVTTLYWVGGSGTWDGTSTSNWATSSGGTGGAGVPNPFTDVVFDSLSNATGYTVTISTNARCRNVNFGAPLTGTLTVSHSAPISVGGDVIYASSGVSTTGTGRLDLYSAAASVLTTNGVTLSCPINVVSYGGVLSFGSATTTTSNITFNGGELNTAGYSVTAASVSRLSVYGTTWTLGASTVTLTNTAAPFSLVTAGVTNSQPVPSFILNSGTSTITYTTSSTTTVGFTGLSWYNYNYTYTGSSAISISEGTSYNNLTINLGTLAAGARTVNFPASSSTVSVAGTLSLSGTNEFSRVLVTGQKQNTRQSKPVIKANVNSASVSYVSFAGFQNVGNTISGTSLGDNSGNTGITFSSPKTVYKVGSSNFYSSDWASTSGGSASAANFPLGQDTVVIDNNSASFDFQTATVDVLDCSSRSTSLTVSGFVRPLSSFTGSSSVTFSSTIQLIGIDTVCVFNQNGSTISSDISLLNSAGLTLSANATIVGQLSLADYSDIATAGFSITAERANFGGYSGFNFSGGGFIELTGVTNTQVLALIPSWLRVTGTSDVRITYSGASSRTIASSTSIAPPSSSSSALNLKITNGTYQLTITGTSGGDFAGFGNLDFTGYSGTFTLSTGNTVIVGDLTYSSTMSTGSVTQTLVFRGTSPQTWTTNGVVTNFSIRSNANVLTLAGAVTLGGVRTFSHELGQLDLAGFTLTVPSYQQSSSFTKSIAFNGGNITVTGTGTVWSGVATNFSRTGTPTVNVSNNSATATTVTTGSLTEAQALDFNYTTGTYALTDNNATYRNLNLTGFSGTFNNSSTRIFYGGFNAGTTATLSAGGTQQNFSATSGTWGITTNGRTLDFPITFNGAGGTWQLQDAATVGSTRTTTLTRGTLDLNGYTYTTGLFSSSGSDVRAIAFGTGQISLSGNNTTIWNNSTATNFTTTGTFKVVATYTGGTGTRTLTQGGTEATVQPISTTGSSGFILDTSSTDVKVINGSWGDIDLTGVTGTFANSARTVFGNFNAGSTVVLSSGANVTTFAATSGTKTITSNGRTLDFPLTFNGVGGTWQLQDALTTGTSRAFTLTSGTFDANNYNVTIGPLSSANSNVRTLALGSGTWTVAGTGADAWNFSTSTNATITGTTTISMTGATAKTFAGGGLTWPVLNQGGAGTLTISGNNTFDDITSTRTAVGACTINFTAGSTQSVNNFTASGTLSGQLTLDSTSSPTRYNLVKLGGGDVNVSYCTISNSNVSP